MSVPMDPEVEAALAALPPLQFADPAAQRLTFAEWAKEIPPPPPDERTTVEKLEVPRGKPGGVPVRVIRPRDTQAQRSGPPCMSPVHLLRRGGGQGPL